MRFYMRRCTPSEPAICAACDEEMEEGAVLEGEYPETDSDRVDIVDGAGKLKTFHVDENDAECVVAALNRMDEQERACSV